MPILFHFNRRCSRRAPARSRCRSGVVRPSSRHRKGAVPHPQPRDLLHQAAAAQPPCSLGRVVAANTSPYACFAFCIRGLRSCWGGAQVAQGSPRVASQRAWAWASLRAGKGKPGGGFTPQTWESGGMLQQHPRKLGQGQNWFVRGSAGWGCKRLSVFAIR